MDITTIPSPARHNGGTAYPSSSQIIIEEQQSQSLSSQDYDPDWDYDDTPRTRCMTYPYDNDSSSLVTPNNLAFGRPFSVFATKGQNNEPLLAMQVKEYNRKHDSTLNLKMDSLEVLIDGCLCSLSVCLLICLHWACFYARWLSLIAIGGCSL